MTREELKQEAEKQVNVCTPYHTGSFIQGYIAAVESWQAKYEKQKEINKELVDENEALKFAARMSEKVEKQLREENAELKELKKKKEEIEIMMNFCKACKKMHTDLLNKAKEIIKGLLSCCRNYPQENAEKMKQAEQFLNGDGCPDTLCEDCTKKDCTVKKLGLVGK